MRTKYIAILLLTIAFLACKRKHDYEGIYHIYKTERGKGSDPAADDVLNQKYHNTSFMIAFNAKAVRVSNSIDPKPIVLHRVNGSNDAVWYTPGGYNPLYLDTTVTNMRLRVTSSDTVLFIPDKFFLSAKSVSSGKGGGMIICYLTKAM
jgi:hypothetical protein